MPSLKNLWPGLPALLSALPLLEKGLKLVVQHSQCAFENKALLDMTVTIWFHVTYSRFLRKIFICLFGCARSHLWHMGSSTFVKSSVAACCCLVAKPCLTLFDPTDCSPPGSSVPGISQARILEWCYHFLLQGIFPTQGSNLSLLISRLSLNHWATDWV